MIGGLNIRGSTAGSSVGGTFRFGHIHWTSTGNTVTFVIETAFKRDVQNSYFKGSASDNLAQVLISFPKREKLIDNLQLCNQEGDVVTLYGREPPIFDFGDMVIVRMLQMKVWTRTPNHSPARADPALLAPGYCFQRPRGLDHGRDRAGPSLFESHGNNAFP
jgi:hypothetical protein